jgi:hypothetical protein
MGAGRLADAEAVYNALLEEDPGEYRAHLGLADCVSARGLSDWAVDHLVEHARIYASTQTMRAAFALMTKALAVAPARLDLHIDVAELEALDGRGEMAALRLENLARTYSVMGREEEAELVLEAASAFLAAPMEVPEDDFNEPEPAPFINPHTGHATPAPRRAVSASPPPLRSAPTPPPPPPTSRAVAVPRPVEPAPTPTPVGPMFRPSPLVEQSAAPPPPPPTSNTPRGVTQVLTEPATPTPPPPKKAKRSSRGRACGNAPKWRPSTIVSEPAPKPRKPAPSVRMASPEPNQRLSISKAPRPRKPAKPIATYRKPSPSIAPAPSPKRGGKKLAKLPPLKQPSNLAARLRAASASPRGPVGDEDRTAMWRPST